MTGRLSAARIGVPQAGQRDPGRTTDCPSGTRAITTLQKLPQIAPNTAASAVASGDDRRAAVSSMRLDAKVPGALKGNYTVVVLRFAALLVLAVGCHGEAPEGAAARRVTPVQAAKPDALAAALRRLGGAHYHATLKMTAGRPGATPAEVTTTTDAWLDRAGNFKFHEENDRDGGRDVVLYGRELAVALRYGKMIRRVAEEPEPTRLLQQALGGPWAAFELGGSRIHADSGTQELVNGARATRYALSLSAGKSGAAPAHLYGLRAWRTGSAVTSVSGRAVVDDATGALLAIDLTVGFQAKTDAGDEQGTLDVHTALSEVASTAAIARPEAAEELVLRQRTVPEAKELLRGLAETGGHRPAAPNPKERH